MSASVSPNTPCGAARPPPARTRLAKEIARQMLLRDLFMPHAPPLRVPSPESGRKALMRGLFMPNAPQTLDTSAPVRTSYRPQRQADVSPPHPVLFVGQPDDVQAAGRSDPVPVVLQPAPVRAMARPNLQILVPRSPVAVQPHPIKVKPAVAHAKRVTFAPEPEIREYEKETEYESSESGYLGDEPFEAEESEPTPTLRVVNAPDPRELPAPDLTPSSPPVPSRASASPNSSVPVRNKPQDRPGSLTEEDFKRVFFGPRLSREACIEQILSHELSPRMRSILEQHAQLAEKRKAAQARIEALEGMMNAWDKANEADPIDFKEGLCVGVGEVSTSTWVHGNGDNAVLEGPLAFDLDFARVPQAWREASLDDCLDKVLGYRDVFCLGEDEDERLWTWDQVRYMPSLPPTEFLVDEKSEVKDEDVDGESDASSSEAPRTPPIVAGDHQEAVVDEKEVWYEGPEREELDELLKYAGGMMDKDKRSKILKWRSHMKAPWRCA